MRQCAVQKQTGTVLYSPNGDQSEQVSRPITGLGIGNYNKYKLIFSFGRPWLWLTELQPISDLCPFGLVPVTKTDTEPSRLLYRLYAARTKHNEINAQRQQQQNE